MFKPVPFKYVIKCKRPSRVIGGMSLDQFEKEARRIYYGGDVDLGMKNLTCFIDHFTGNEEIKNKNIELSVHNIPNFTRNSIEHNLMICTDDHCYIFSDNKCFLQGIHGHGYIHELL